MNPTNTTTTKKSLLLRSIKPVIFALLYSAVAFYLFSSLGPIYRYLHADVTFLVLPLLGFYLLRLISRLCEIFFPTRWGFIASLILNGLAFSFFSFIFFNHAPELANIPSWSHFQLFFTYLKHLAVPAVMFFSGYTVAKLVEPIKLTTLGSRVFPIILSIGQSLIGYSLWRAFSVFYPSWSPSRGIGLILFIGMLTVAVSGLGEYGLKSKYPIFVDSSDWLKTSPVGKFYLGTLFATYFIFIRPAVMSATPWGHIIEWLIVCGISWYIVATAKASLDDKYCLPVKETDWQKHSQEISESVSEDFKRLVRLQEGFVRRSDKVNLVDSLQQTLKLNNMSDDEINSLLANIKEHKDRKVPWYAFGVWKRRILMKNHQIRREVLAKTISNLETVSQPTRQNI
jgi:hypothetical protein